MAGVDYYEHSTTTTTTTTNNNNQSTNLLSDMESDIDTRPWSGQRNRRSELLAYLRSTVRETGDFIHFPNKLTLFKELQHILSDETWQVRHECLQLITELIPLCGDDLDECLDVVLARLVRSLGHPKVVVRRASVQTIHSYMKQTEDVHRVLEAIVAYGLESEELGLSQECIVFSIPMLLTPDFEQVNYLVLVRALFRHLANEEKRQAALFSLEKIRRFIGADRFDEYLDKLQPGLVKEYERMLESPSGSPMLDFDDETTVDETADEWEDERPLEFGIVPQTVMIELNDEDNWEYRWRGVDSLRQIINGLSDVSVFVPHIASFLVLLNRLVGDVNFKIATLSLEIYKILIDKVKYRIRPHLNIVVNSLSKHLPDSKVVIRSGCIKALMQLMQCVSPMPVMSVLTGNLQHKSSRLREETLNLMMAALLTFPSYEFDLVVLCNAVAPMILDPKRKIRQAVLECLATLSQALGPTRSSPLMEVVEGLQRENRGSRFVVAVQATLARRVLPRVTVDGFVEYSVHVPISAGRRMMTASQGADVDWILAGAGSLSMGSARDRDAGSGTSRSSTGESYPGSPAMSRRIVSPGRGKSRLPWDCDVRDPPMRARALSDDNVYVKSKGNSPTDKSKTNRSTTSARYSERANFGPFWEDKNHGHHVTPGATQKQLYLRKLRHHADKTSERVPFGTLSILPDKPKTVHNTHERSGHQRPLHGASILNLPLGDGNLSSTGELKDDLSGGDTPVPTRPTIVRNSSAHKHRKVPPIASSDKWYNMGSESSESSSGNQLEDIENHNWDQNEVANDRRMEKRDDRGLSFIEDVPFNKPVLVRSPSLSKLRGGSAVNNNNESDIDNLEEDINVVGRGMLVSKNGANLAAHLGGISVSDVSLKPIQSDVVHLPMVDGANRLSSDDSNSGPDHFSSSYSHSLLLEAISDDEEEQPMSMSQTTRERLLFKKQELLRKAEKKQAEQHRRLVEQPSEDDTIEEISVEPLPKLQSPAPLRRSKSKSPGSRKSTDKSPSPGLITPSKQSASADLKPFTNPESGLQEAMHSLNNSEWTSKCEGIQMVMRLLVNHPEVLLSDLHNVTVSLLREVKNLRSSVSRVAISGFGSLFTNLRRHMETHDLDNVVKVLLHKSGESNKFLQEDTEKALLCMVETINPQRAALAVIQGGASHKNANVRKLTSQLLAEITYKLGAAKVLTGGTKDGADKILPTAAQFVMDSSPHTRYYGRLIFHMIIFHPSFDSVLHKTLQPNVIRNISNILEGIRAKGAGEKPSIRV